MRIILHNSKKSSTLETLTQIRGYADYLAASSHILSSNGMILTAFVAGLIEKGDPEQDAKFMFDEVGDAWAAGYNDAEEPLNGDFKFIRTDKLDAIMAVIKRLSDRVIELYPTQKAAIDKATSQVYGFVLPTKDPTYDHPFYDIADYAKQLAQETQDEQLATISADLDNAFNNAIICYRDVNWCTQHLDHYSMSVCLVTKDDYLTGATPSSIYISNFNTGYEQSAFHQLTGCGNWLGINEQDLLSNPRCGVNE